MPRRLTNFMKPGTFLHRAEAYFRFMKKDIMSRERNLRIEVPSPGEDLVVVEGSIPDCPPSGVVIKTTSAGICHSDVYLWRNQWRIKDDVVVSLTYFSDNVKWPMTMGHEVCGEVYAIGQEAKGEPTHLQIGDQVVVFPYIGCGECGICYAGMTNICPKGGVATDIGLGVHPGGYQSYLAVEKKHYVLKVTEDIPSNIACMFGCSALTAFSAASRAKTSIERAAKCGKASFLIIGAGGLGLWCIQIARALYPSNTKIYVADIAEDKLAVAKEYGADEGILWPKGANELELIEKTKQVTGGVDGAADFVGLPATCTRAFQAASKGATISVVGLAGGTFPIPIVSAAVNDITIAASYVGNREQMADLVELYKNKKLKSPPLVNIRPEEVNDALLKLEEGKISGRAIINFK